MYTPITTTKFNKDLKRAKRRQKDLQKLKNIILKLVAGKPLLHKNRDHLLTGNFVDRRECHIDPDWLLIYKVNEEKKEIIFERTGTHSDLF